MAKRKDGKPAAEDDEFSISTLDADPKAAMANEIVKPQQQQEEPEEKPVPPPPPESTSVVIEIPLCGETDTTGYVPTHVEVGTIPRAVGLALFRMREGLNRGNVRLASGRHVTTNADAMRWLLEKVAAEMAHESK